MEYSPGKSKIWMVRAGQRAFLIDEFLENDLVAVGWNDTGKIQKDISYEDLKSLMIEKYPDLTSGQINQSTSQLWKFYHEFKKGDIVVSYAPDERAYYVGTIKSEYHHSLSYEFQHFRNVEWEEGPHHRDQLTIESKNLLGSILTIFEIPESVLEDLEQAHPAYMSPEEWEELEAVQERYEEYQKDEEERIIADAISRSTEFIKDQLVKLSWEDMEILVAGILRTMGYKTRMTSRGSDLGSDIMASPDGLGMIEPIVKVEVKHRIKSKEKVGSDDVRNFVGGLRNTTKGIYVSTTGFSKEANYEAERANFHITLIDFDLLVELLVENYETLDSEVKALIPLRKIYWPI